MVPWMVYSIGPVTVKRCKFKLKSAYFTITPDRLLNSNRFHIIVCKKTIALFSRSLIVNSQSIENFQTQNMVTYSKNFIFNLEVKFDNFFEVQNESDSKASSKNQCQKNQH